MDNFKTLLIILWTLFFLYIFFEIYLYLKYKKWLQSLKNVPSDIKNRISQFCLYKILTPTQQKIIEYKVNRFINEKEFIGVGINIDKEIKITIAFYACIETIGYEEYCYPNLKYIYIYPAPIVLKNINQNGILQNSFIASGEAFKDSVVIVWNEVKKDFHIKRNVIIHEFAHELDYENYFIQGMPPLDKKMHDEWVRIIFKEYERLKKASLKPKLTFRVSLIDKYALTNKAEFFAVMSEYFFSKPQFLKKHFPKIYNEFKKFFKIDPIKVKDVC